MVRKNFNSYGSRRGNHEVMIRGTFANIRLRNLLAPGTEGGFTRHLPDGEAMSIFAAATRYAAERVPLIILAGAEYGLGLHATGRRRAHCCLASRRYWRPRLNESTVPT